MPAWLLFVANLPVALSLLIKGTIRFTPLRTELKKTLAGLNRIQKKSLMWLSSRCKSSVLPELGLMVMVIVIALGFLIKFKLCPKAFCKYAYQVHTQSLIFLTMFMVLTVGHLIVD